MDYAGPAGVSANIGPCRAGRVANLANVPFKPLRFNQPSATPSSIKEDLRRLWSLWDKATAE